jgi:hypothetical protein
MNPDNIQEWINTGFCGQNECEYSHYPPSTNTSSNSHIIHRLI